MKLIRRYEDTPEISCRGWLPHVRRLPLRETHHRFSFAPLGSFPNSFHFLKIFLKHDAMNVFLERIKDIKYRIFYECWRRKKETKRKEGNTYSALFSSLQRIFYSPRCVFFFILLRLTLHVKNASKVIRILILHLPIVNTKLSTKKQSK